MRAPRPAAVLLLCVGCTGSLFGPRPEPPPPVEPPPDGPVCPDVPPVPPRTPLRRLTFTETDNALNAVSGTALRPLEASQLRDSVQRGFTNNAEVLTVDPTLVDVYARAAEAVAHDVMVREFDVGAVKRFELETRMQDGGAETLQQTCCGDDLYNNRVQPWSCLGASPPPASQCFREFYNAYSVHTATYLDGPGTWTVSTRTYALTMSPGDPLGDGGFVPDAGELADGGVLTLMPAQFRVVINGHVLPFAPVTAPQSAPTLQTVTIPPDVIEQAGFYEVDFYLDLWTGRDVPRAGADFLELRRASAAVPLANRRVYQCEPDSGRACIEDTVLAFAHRAWRRPLAEDERLALSAFLDTALTAGDSPREALELTLQRVLLSPHFVYRVERVSAFDPQRLSGPSLATRLSTLLWSSVPDDALLALAERGGLDTDEGVRQTAVGLLGDARSVAFEREFGAQWLGAPLVSQASLSPTQYPLFTPAVKASMEQEIRFTFANALRGGVPALDLVDADYTFVDDTLAGHYGLPLPGSPTPVRVAVPDRRRGGALSFGGVLAYNSKPVSPMPTRRGHWVLAQLVCDEPPPPPGNIPVAMPTAGLTLRQVFEAHAQNPACAGCHLSMDPVGFGLESYDADGRWRTQDAAGLRIDSTGKLPDGRTFDGPVELKSLLRQDPRTRSCIAQQLYVYATNRSFTPADRCLLPALTGTVDDTLPKLIERIVTSQAFTRYTAEAP